MVAGMIYEVFLVNVNWNDVNQNWNFNTWHLGNEWNAGNQFVPRNSRISRHFSFEVPGFRFQPFLPSANHAAQFLHAFGNLGIFFILECADFPCDAQQKF